MTFIVLTHEGIVLIASIWNFDHQVAQYLHSRSWDTRVAAAQAIGAIAENVKYTSLSELFDILKVKVSEAGICTNVEDIITLPCLQSKLVSTIAFQRLYTYFYSFVHFFFPVDSFFPPFFFFSYCDKGQVCSDCYNELISRLCQCIFSL